MDKFSSVSEFSSVSKSVSKGGYKKTKLVSKFHSAPAHVRVRKGANARNERLNAAMLSLDRLLDGRDPAKDPLLGDRGESAARMYRTLDPERGTSADDTRARRLGQAMLLLVLTGDARLCETLGLICENGNDREASCAKVPRPTYFRHRARLLEIFSETQVHMDI